MFKQKKVKESLLPDPIESLVWENPLNLLLVKRDMSAAYRRILGYGTAQPGAEQLDDGDDIEGDN